MLQKPLDALGEASVSAHAVVALWGLLQRDDRVEVDELGFEDFLRRANDHEDACAANLMLIPVCEEVQHLSQLPGYFADGFCANLA